MVKRYCITLPLVLISFGGMAIPPKNIWGEGVPPRLTSTTPLAQQKRQHFLYCEDEL